MSRSHSLIALLLLAAGCPENKPQPNATSPTTPQPAAKAPATTAAATTGQPASAPAAPVAAAPARPEPQARPGGPSRETCERAAAHLGTFVVESMVPQGAGDKEREYVNQLVDAERPNVVRFCLETASVEEMDCVLAAKSFPELASCERFRRQVPADLAKRDEVSEEDCEKLFVRLKQFKLDEGVPGEQIDATKDQIIRACLERAKPGTVACFITAHNYEEARRCP